MTFVDMFLNYWWLILGIIAMPYTLYFLNILLKKIKNKRTKKKNAWIYEPVISEEKKHLGFEVDKSEIEGYKNRIENLIITLNQKTSTVAVNAVEAIMIVDLFSDSVLVNESGELVIDVHVAKNFSKEIYHNPQKFMNYIGAIENKINMSRKDNKIDLEDVLYMMRNAKKFGLYLDSEDTSLTYKIKSAIHASEYQDVILRIVDDIKKAEDETTPTSIILTNTFVDKNIQEVPLKNDEPEMDKDIASIEKIEGDRILVTMKDGRIVEKDDIMIYRVIEPLAEDDVPENQKVQTAKEEIKKLAQKEDTRLKDYISRFGELDFYEKENQAAFKFKDRSLRFFDKQVADYIAFKHQDFKTKNFFSDEEFYLYFLSKLFDIEHSIFNNMPHIFIGDLALKNKDTSVRYVTIDIHYLLSFIYMTIKREDRESFFKFIYSGKDINVQNINIFLKNINDATDIFFHDGKGFLNDAAYVIADKIFKSTIIRFNIEILGQLLDSNISIKNNYAKLKESVDGLSKVKAFGESAKKIEADILYSHNTFFRVPLEEKTF
ncbi:MAG: hypothetical protein WC656_01195 [Sulfurimonas sp.]|jgi:hypothetical protein